MAPRCFLAVPLEEPALGAAATLMDGLRAEFDGVRWARPEGLHVTVHFFGPLPEERWDAMTDAVAPVAAGASPFELRIEGLGAFPAHGPPRVLWLGAADGREPLARLVAACAERLAAVGVAVETHEHAPHVTLGRPRARWDGQRRRAWREREAALPSFTARRVVLYESLPGPGGSRYVVRREVPFGGGR